VEEETRERVLKAAEELRYQPSGLARSLKRGRTQTIAFIVPDINSLFYPMIMRSIEHCAAEKGYTLILCNTERDREREDAALRMLRSRAVDGILAMSVRDGEEELADFSEETGIPVVRINRSFGGRLDTVSADFVYGSRLAAEHLLQLGHRRIAGYFGDRRTQRFRDRYEGYAQALTEHGLAVREEDVVCGLESMEDAYRAALEMFPEQGAPGSGDRPTAVFASMDILAIGIYRALAQRGYRVPEDVSVIGFDNVFLAQYMNPPLTSHDHLTGELASESVRLLLERIEEGDAGGRESGRGGKSAGGHGSGGTLPREPRNILIRGRIEERASTAAPSAAGIPDAGSGE
jgi:DNA-binding LacI/PurR family transcriptional regulator